MKHLLISIIIPTYYGSTEVVKIPLESIRKQTFSKKYFEIILAHNAGANDSAIRKLSKDYGAKMITLSGKPPQTCNQVNEGARVAKGKYIFILDHDIALSPRLLEHFAALSKDNAEIDAWYAPYKIVARGRLLNNIRNFEEQFYKNSVIAAVRIIKKNVFWRTEKQYDPMLNAGPGDWDLTNQLRVINAKFGYITDFVYHHEEGLSLWQFVTKKTIYAEGGELYKNKWKNKNAAIYSTIVKKQYDPIYRLVGIFIEKGKWKKLVTNLHLYALYLATKVSMSLMYLHYLKMQRKSK